MEKNKLLRAAEPWLEGIILLILRLLQLRTGFDPDTGLALPSLAGRGLWIVLLLVFAADALRCFSRPRGGDHAYARCFDRPGAPTLVSLITGSLLLLAGGLLLFLLTLPATGTAAITATAAGLFGIAGGFGLLILVISLRTGAPTAMALPPAMFFSVLFVLSVYFPVEADPVLARYGLPVLGAAMAAYFLYQLSGFFRSEGNLRWFDLVSGFAAVTCIASAADCLRNPGRLLVYLGFAVTATAFRLLLRREPLPEAPEPASDEEAAADA